MLNKFRTMKDDEGGFTLIELLVVILIIGILAAVALPTFLNQGKKGADAAAQSDLRAVATKVEACATQTNDYTVCLPSGTTASDGTAKGSDPEAPTFPVGMAKVSASSSAYVLSRATPKGATTTWYIQSTGGNVGAPTGTAPS